MWKFPELINPLQPGVAFLYPLKTSENLKFCGIIRGYRKTIPGCNGLNKQCQKDHRVNREWWLPYMVLINPKFQNSLFQKSCVKGV